MKRRQESPLTGWYMTTDGMQGGFQARSVVNAVFIKMLADPENVGEMEGIRRE